MRRLSLWTALSAVSALAAASTALVQTPLLQTHKYPDPIKVTGDTDHDPSLAKGPDGTYFLFGTGNQLLIHSSPDRVNWTYIGDVFPSSAPVATDPYTRQRNGDLWAPDVTWVASQKRFVMYYTASSMGSRHSALFLAFSSTALPGTWTDGGKVLETSEDDRYNAIDPNLIILPSGEWYLTFGSYWQGLFTVQLDPNTGKLLHPDRKDYVHLAKRGGGGAEEAAWVYRASNGYFYLFSSFDICCRSTDSTYNIRVSRADNVLGPYVDKDGSGGTIILSTHGSTIGPGGQALLNDVDGPILAYHYYVPGKSVVGLNRLDFSSGWPVVVD
ncbi:arabinan endo-1,5-alpha-L-arabinosidase [Rhodotorula paludigena]|uniref:arabinan endo-1,5-alpha-L-arabinosidase n=1 Tax=Rhodotorula paludigena TaxID=86838 RepID=UPI00316EEB81